MKKGTAGIIALVLLSLITSCSKEKEEIAIIINPLDLFIRDAQPGEVVTMTIECLSPADLRQLIITSRIEGSYSTVEMDTALENKKFYMRYEYMVPDMIESKDIILEFTLTDSDGSISTNARIIEVRTVAVYLKETSGHQMYSGHSGKQDAYNLVSGLPLFSHLSQAVNKHIADTSDSDVLLRRWTSPAGVKFVRFNGFDYANCTNVSIRSGYNAGIKTDFVENLNAGDILLAAINSSDLTKTYVAIRISEVIDGTGAENDRYVFSLKK